MVEVQDRPANETLRQGGFDAMRLEVGMRVQLFLRRDLKAVQHFSSLIGYVKDEYLLVKMPFENGAPVLLHDGEQVTVRVFTGTAICSFNSTVLRSFFNPFFYMHLSFPEVIQKNNLRKAVRVRVRIPGQVQIPMGNGLTSAASVTLANISTHGALIESEFEIGTVADRLALSFTAAGTATIDETDINTDIVIRNVNIRHAGRGEDGNTHLYGVQFADLEPAHRAALANLIYAELLSNRQSIV
ncbi:flagellar brake protein [Oxalobacteraceae bacterium OM1]|nr:flagellar brake protein [Oxalobacteraceae bacterium OM1]